MMNLKIRRGLLPDIETIAQFQVEMALETENYKLDQPTVTKGVQHIIDHPEKGEYLVAVVDEKIVGSLLLLPEWSDWRNKTILWIHSLFVIKDMRGHGIYKKMYQTVLDKVSGDSNLAGVRLYVDKTNLNAKYVYEKLGMNGEHYQVFEQMKE